MDLLHEQKLYLASRIKECEQRPDLNTYIKGTLEKHFAKINNCSSFEEYTDWVGSTGNYFDLSQAEQLDRYSNFIKIQQFYQNKKQEEYYLKKLESVKESTDHNSLNKNLTEIEKEISEEKNRSVQAIQEVVNIQISIMEYLTAPDVKKNKEFDEVKTKWAKLKQLDPYISLDKILTYPPYRHASLFEDERIVELFGNIREVMQ